MPRRIAAALPIAAFAAATALAVAGCGGTVVDAAKTEAAIKANVERRTGVEVASVDCPGGVEVTAGARFRCSVRTDSGLRATAEMLIRNSDADLTFESLKAAK